MSNNRIYERFIIENNSTTQNAANKVVPFRNDCEKIECIWTDEFPEIRENDGLYVEKTITEPPKEDKEEGNESEESAKAEKKKWKNFVVFAKRFSKKHVNKQEKQDIQITAKNSDIPTLEELKAWYLDDNCYVQSNFDTDSPEWEVDGMLRNSEKGREWYAKYKAEHGEMNFPAAIKYLNDNPSLDQEVKEYIKNAFGICDGDISNNTQGGKGTCHLLACREELDNSPALEEIAKNIVQQNDDGTVTVTFYGIEEDSGESIKFTITNKEISDSYKYKDIYNQYGGSSDPDDAALEIAYQRLAEILVDKYEKIDKLADEKSENLCIESLNNICEELSQKEDKNEDEKKLLEFLNNNLPNFKNIGFDKLIHKITMEGLLGTFRSILNTHEIINKVFEVYKDADSEKGQMLDKYGFINFKRFDKNNPHSTLGGYPAITFKILTGKEGTVLNVKPPHYSKHKNNKFVLEYKKKAVDKFLSKTDIHTTPILLSFIEDNEELNLLAKHAYPLEDIYIDKETNIKMVRLKNTHGYDVKLKYDDFLENIENLTYLDV